MTKAEMKQEPRERPILFSGPMVNAILEGRKTMTRRVVKTDLDILKVGTTLEWSQRLAQNPCFGFTPSREQIEQKAKDLEGKMFPIHTDNGMRGLYSPYGKPGDRLWVRETWQTHSDLDHVKPSELRKGALVQYPATYDHWDSKKRPSIFMPRWASRITLEITNVRVERLQDISSDDAKAEGWGGYLNSRIEGDDIDCVGNSSRTWFHKLWDKINGKKYPWASNPWVWIVEFQRI